MQLLFYSTGRESSRSRYENGSRPDLQKPPKFPRILSSGLQSRHAEPELRPYFWKKEATLTDLYGAYYYSQLHRIGIDDYVVDVLLPDLAGHDRSPNAFLVYLVLWTILFREEERQTAVSLQQLAERTGISKSSVQSAIRLLKRRKLILVRKASATAVPQYELIRHWVRRRSKKQ